jgi:hypothetical protein
VEWFHTIHKVLFNPTSIIDMNTVQCAPTNVDSSKHTYRNIYDCHDHGLHYDWVLSLCTISIEMDSFHPKYSHSVVCTLKYMLIC